MNHAVYDPTSGNIVQTGSGAAPESPIPGFAVLPIGDGVTGATHWVDTSGGSPVLTAYTVAQADARKAIPAYQAQWSNASMAWQGTLDDVKAAKWAEMKAHRDAIEYGTFTWDTSTFDADPVSTSRIMGAFALALAAQAAGQPYSETWVLSTNETRVLSAADMLAVGAALGAQVSSAFATANALRSQIDAATSIAEVEAIAWP